MNIEIAKRRAFSEEPPFGLLHTVKPMWTTLNTITKAAIKPSKQIDFPMVEETVTYDNPFDRKYTLHFKGNTLVDISPRETNPTAYPIYQREHYKQNQAPMKKVTRFAPAKTVTWWASMYHFL